MAARQNPRRHLYLLISLLVIFTVSPFFLTYRHGPVVINIIAAAVLVTATYAVGERKSFFIFALIVSAFSIAMTFWLFAWPSSPAMIVSHSTLVVLTTFFAVAILGYVLRSGRVTSDKIYAAVCVYLLFGYAWAFAYALADEVRPGSFTTPTPIAANDVVGRVMQMRYFSFVTLATLGYGDIVPRTPTARTLALLEAMLGQFYLVALIGRLVGLHIVHGNSSPDENRRR